MTIPSHGKRCSQPEFPRSQGDGLVSPFRGQVSRGVAAQREPLVGPRPPLEDPWRPLHAAGRGVGARRKDGGMWSLSLGVKDSANYEVMGNETHFLYLVWQASRELDIRASMMVLVFTWIEAVKIVHGSRKI